MVGWDDFFLGLLTNIISAIIISATVYFLITRAENKKGKNLTKNVLERINLSLNTVISNVLYNLQNDAFEPIGYLAALSNTPVPKCVIDMTELRFELTTLFKRKADMSEVIVVRKRQLSVLLTEEFLFNLKLVVGQWDNKQWLKYYNLFQNLSIQLKDLLDTYQSRMSTDLVCKVMDLEKKASDSLNMVTVLPEFFCKIEQLTIELNNKQVTERHQFHLIACEELQVIIKEIAIFQDTIINLPKKKPLAFSFHLRKVKLRDTLKEKNKA